MKKFIYILAAAAALVFTSCVEKTDIEEPEAPDNSESAPGDLYSSCKLFYGDYSFAFVDGVLYESGSLWVSESEYEGRYADPYHHLSVDAEFYSADGAYRYVYVVADYDTVQEGHGPVKISVTDESDKKLLSGYETEATKLVIERKTGKVYIEADGFIIVRNDLLEN